jgi:hypothetical protein
MAYTWMWSWSDVLVSNSRQTEYDIISINIYPSSKHQHIIMSALITDPEHYMSLSPLHCEHKTKEERTKDAKLGSHGVGTMYDFDFMYWSSFVSKRTTVAMFRVCEDGNWDIWRKVGGPSTQDAAKRQVETTHKLYSCQTEIRHKVLVACDRNFCSCSQQGNIVIIFG